MSDTWIRPYEENLPSETIIMPVVGYRIWYVPLQPILTIRSWSAQTLWEPCKRLEAECNNHMSCVCAGEFWSRTKREPEEPFMCSCSAGIYAWRTFDQGFEMYMDEIEKMFGLAAPEPTANRVCFGKVYLWGKMIECEKGFRAQYAYPAGFYYTAANTKALTAMYRVPLLTIKDHHEPHLCP